MTALIGIIVVFTMVFGGYLLAGGKLGIILKALPFEFMMIGGAAIGALLIANDGHAIKNCFGGLKKSLAGSAWKKDDYTSILCLLFELLRLAKQDPIALEEHIEQPTESSIFSKYPTISKNKFVTELICDTLRMNSLNFDDPHQVEDLISSRLKDKQHEQDHSTHAIQTVADGLPALGIVAAVLGVIKTMASIDQPPEVLGRLIGGALVGTFLGVFLAYGFFGPFASRMSMVFSHDDAFDAIIKETLVANLHGHSTNICVEVGRQHVTEHFRPSFSELEEAIKLTKNET